MTTTTAQLPATALRFRTEQERRADRYEATAFFARFDGYRPNSGDWRWRSIRMQIIEREVFDSKLLVATREAHEWSQQHKDGAPQRLAKRALSDGKAYAAALALDPNLLREYVDAQTRWSMPAPQLGTQTVTERARQRAAGRGYATRITTSLHADTAGARYLRAISQRENFPFEHWLLLPQNWNYGPQLPAPFEGFNGHLRPDTDFRSTLTHYRAGRITVVGMTPERALQIAIASLDVTARPAPVSRAERRAARDEADAAAEARRQERVERVEQARAARERTRQRIAADRALEARQGGY